MTNHHPILRTNVTVDPILTISVGRCHDEEVAICIELADGTAKYFSLCAADAAEVGQALLNASKPAEFN